VSLKEIFFCFSCLWSLSTTTFLIYVNYRLNVVESFLHGISTAISDYNLELEKRGMPRIGKMIFNHIVPHSYDEACDPSVDDDDLYYQHGKK